MLFKKRFRIQSTRLPGWDYISAGWYFVTIYSRDRKPVFGAAEGDEVSLSPAGGIVAEEWLQTPQVRSNVTLDEWVLMPNHLRGIVVIQSTDAVETPRRGVSTHAPRPYKRSVIL